MRHLIIYITFGIFSFHGIAKNRTVDSLINNLNNQKVDSIVYKTCLKIAKIYTDSAYDKSLLYLNKALFVAERSNDRNQVAHVYHQIGNSYQRKGEFSLALVNLNNALEIYTFLNNKKGAGQLLNDIGLIYRAWGKYDKALENYIKALVLFDEIGDSTYGAITLNNIGQIYYFREEYDKSIEYFKKYLTVNKKNNTPRAVAGAANNIASAYLELKKYDAALDFYIRSMRIYDSLGIKLGVAIIKDNIGSLFLRKQQYNDALLYHIDALKFFEDLGSPPRICASLQNIGLVYSKLNNTPLAIKYLTRSLNIAIKLKQKETQKAVYEALSDIYVQTKNHEKALLNYKLYVQIKDSLLNAETFGKIETIQAEYDAQKKEKELAEINHQLYNQRIIIIISTGLFILFIFLIMLFIRENTQKKKTIKKSSAQTSDLYILLNKTGYYFYNYNLQNNQNHLSSMFQKSWNINLSPETQDPYFSFQKDSFICFAFISLKNANENSNLVYLSVIDFYHSLTQIYSDIDIKALYHKFLKESNWHNILEKTDTINVDFWIYNQNLRQAQYFGSNSAFSLNNENFITNLKNSDRKWLKVGKRERFYFFTSSYYYTPIEPELDLLYETLSKAIVKTSNISFEEQKEIFCNTLELIKAGDEFLRDISIFAFMI
ncbi:MAG: tetratricopeptide repeat protein [Bacteroidales bacterium]|nr:tetratricopeptide repeat protein [Bacteroidales bacterium]